MDNKTCKMIINGKLTECKIVSIYQNDTIRIEYPVYRDGKYDGYIEETVYKNQVIIE